MGPGWHEVLSGETTIVPKLLMLKLRSTSRWMQLASDRDGGRRKRAPPRGEDDQS
ncbi:hypothetical protein J4Q44_G00280760 [Coregonus suidteri]|uniref:Uncharacterized protein n=1 Tax=Coregonus suidteri TaxID=861788 RepID=A0AAN8L1S5_9TELE